MDFEGIWNRLSNLPIPTVTKISPLADASPGSLESTELSGGVTYLTKVINAYDYPDSPIVTDNGFGDYVKLLDYL